MAELIKADSEISAEALRKAEEYVAAGRGRRQPAVRLGGHSGDRRSPSPMTLFHLYAAYDIVPTAIAAALHPRRLRAAAELPAVPAGEPLPQPHHVVRRDPAAAPDRGHHLCAPAAATTSPIAPRCRNRWDIILGVIFIVLCWKRRAAPPAGSCRSVAVLLHALRLFRAVSAAALDASRLRHWRGWSVICSSRWKASSAFRSTCRRR